MNIFNLFFSVISPPSMFTQPSTTTVMDSAIPRCTRYSINKSGVVVFAKNINIVLKSS